MTQGSIKFPSEMSIVTTMFIETIVKYLKQLGNNPKPLGPRYVVHRSNADYCIMGLKNSWLLLQIPLTNY